MATSPKLTAAAARQALKKFASPAKAQGAMRFFKTGKGQYGEGDVFIGVTAPELRAVAKASRDLPDAHIKTLLRSKIHEERALALAIWALQIKRADAPRRRQISAHYQKHFVFVNNWDLVDMSAPVLLAGVPDPILLPRLGRWARSPHLWTRRVAMVATLFFIRQGNAQPTLTIARLLMRDTHDLIHKATGWMLREVGKHCGEATLTRFLDSYTHQLPRTALRYAIERLTPAQRRRYLAQR